MTNSYRTPKTQTLTTAIPTFYPDEPAPALGAVTPELPAPPADLSVDTQSGDSQSDTVSGGDTQDSISGGQGNDTISGGDGNDSVAAATAPDAYEIKITGDDGKDVDLDPELLAAATPVFKSANLTNEQAQAVAAFYAKDVLPSVSNFIQQQTLDLLGIGDMADWTKNLKADKEIGGAKFEESLTVIAQGREAFATPELRTLLETTRLGNHPEVNRLFFKVGSLVKEGKIVTGDQGAQTRGGVESFYDPAFSPKS